MSIFDFLADLVKKFGDWFADIFKHSEELYEKLTDEEKKAAEWAYGVIAVVNANLDKVPAEIKEIIADKYPDLSPDLIHGFLDRLLNDLKAVDNKIPLTLEDALEALKTYLSKLDGDVWKTISSGVGSALAVLLSPGTPVQKFTAVAEYIYQVFVKPHVEDIKVKPQNDPHNCPQGYVWNGSQCVKDVG
jgi:hypothetical protein